MGVQLGSGNLAIGFPNNTATVTVRNLSTKAGEPVAYTFKVLGGITVNGITVLDPMYNPKSITVSAGGSGTVSFPFSIPPGILGLGIAYAWLYTTDYSKLISGPVSTGFSVP
jgi:hypothetical protein